MRIVYRPSRTLKCAQSIESVLDDLPSLPAPHTTCTSEMRSTVVHLRFSSCFGNELTISPSAMAGSLRSVRFSYKSCFLCPLSTYWHQSCYGCCWSILNTLRLQVAFCFFRRTFSASIFTSVQFCMVVLNLRRTILIGRSYRHYFGRQQIRVVRSIIHFNNCYLSRFYKMPTLTTY